MVDRSRLVKLLNITESQHDAEALAAIRRSNDLLRRSKTSWVELLLAQISFCRAPPLHVLEGFRNTRVCAVPIERDTLDYVSGLPNSNNRAKQRLVTDRRKLPTF